jgi:hypothetical protein
MFEIPWVMWLEKFLATFSYKRTIINKKAGTKKTDSLLLWSYIGHLHGAYDSMRLRTAAQSCRALSDRLGAWSQQGQNAAAAPLGLARQACCAPAYAAAALNTRLVHLPYQPPVFFSQNKPVTSNQPAVLFSQKKPVLMQNLHPTSSTQQAEQASFTREKIPRRASQFSLKINKRQSS